MGDSDRQRPLSALDRGCCVPDLLVQDQKGAAINHPSFSCGRGAVVFGLACISAPAFAEKRIALVIGNSAYRNVARLDNPKNDASLMAETLRGLGFTLIGNGAQIDLDKAAFDDVLQKFGNQLVGADVALFYYAGHGIQVRGSNYLVPVNANPAREADVLLQMVDTALVLAAMEGSGTKLNMVLLDACRNNPFGGRGLRATEGGLAQMHSVGAAERLTRPEKNHY
jgi:uncharacterized caspase-like protein